VARALRRAIALEPGAIVRRAVARVVHVELGIGREHVRLLDYRGIEPVGEDLRAARVRGAHGEAVYRRQVAGREIDRPAVRGVAHAELLGLRLVEGGERAAARVAEERDAPVALAAQEGDAGAEVLDAALHGERRVVAGETGVEREDGAAAPLERLEQVVAEEIARRVDDDERELAAA